MMKLRGWFYRLFLRLFRREIWYINGPETLPPPIPHDEEERLFAALMEGDTSVKNTLIVHNLRLVVYIAKRFESTGINVEDMISIGTIGLIKAVNTFRPDKNIKLATYASRCIENEILMCIRKNTSRKQELSIDEPLHVDYDGNELLVSDVVGIDNSAVYRGIESEAELLTLDRVVAGLPEKERNIIALRFGLSGGKEHTQKEVAELVGISQSYISRLEKRILSKLKQGIEVCDTQ